MCFSVSEHMNVVVGVIISVFCFSLLAHFGLSLNNCIVCVSADPSQHYLPHRPVMIVWRLASEPVITVGDSLYLSISISLFLSFILSLFRRALERAITEAVCLGGVGSPAVVRKSNQSVTSLCVCV